MAVRKTPARRRKKKEVHRLVIDSPKFGPVGRDLLLAVVDRVCDALEAEYGEVLREVKPIANLQTGLCTLMMQTHPITEEDASDICALCVHAFHDADPLLDAYRN